MCSPLKDNLGGRFDLTTTATGMFSGSVTLGARAKIAFTNLLLQVSGAGDQVLTGTITWLTIADTTTTKLAAIVEVFVADQIARLTLTHPNGTQLAVPAWKGINPATPYATKYSARFSGGSSGEPSPNGYGFDTFTIANRGALTLAGRLPDGMAYTTASFVGHRGEVLANQLLYTYKGSLTGQLAIAPATPVTSNTLTGSRTWNKPAISTETVFKLGFAPPHGQCERQRLRRPCQRRTLHGHHHTGCRAQLCSGWSHRGLHTNAHHCRHRPHQQSYHWHPADERPLPVIGPATGAFSGSFTIPGATAPLNRPAPFFGQIVRIGSITQGYGYFLLAKVPVGTESVTASPKLSGAVELRTP